MDSKKTIDMTREELSEFIAGSGKEFSITVLTESGMEAERNFPAKKEMKTSAGEGPVRRKNQPENGEDKGGAL